MIDATPFDELRLLLLTVEDMLAAQSNKRPDNILLVAVNNLRSWLERVLQNHLARKFNAPQTVQGAMLDNLRIEGNSSDLEVEDCTSTVEVAAMFDDNMISIFLEPEQVRQLRDWLNAWLQKQTAPQTVEGEAPLFVLAKGTLPHMEVLHSDEMHWTQRTEQVWTGTHHEVWLRSASLRSCGMLDGEAAGPIMLKTWQSLVADTRLWTQPPALSAEQ